MAKILVVDDVPDSVAFLSLELGDDGHEVLCCNNGEECLRLANESAPDIILLDVNMPVLDGIQTLSKLKSSPKTRDIPVIMVTADNDQVIEALDKGAHDYVTKPFVYPILAARMRSALRLVESQRELYQANENLARLASVDPLTNVFNRRFFLERAKGEFNNAQRHKSSLSLIMLDADKFKAINDRYGHAMGDSALIDLARICGRAVRASDFIGRLGGEEFIICCPYTDLAGAEALAERIRSAIAEHTVVHKDQSCTFTVSLGVTQISGADLDLDSCKDRCDQLLYKAKQQGRNRTIAL